MYIFRFVEPQFISFPLANLSESPAISENYGLLYLPQEGTRHIYVYVVWRGHVCVFCVFCLCNMVRFVRYGSVCVFVS